MQFRYLAYSTADGIIKGKLDATTERDARNLVVRLGYRPLKVLPARGIPSPEEMFPSLFRVSTTELIRFSRQLATILDSGGNLLQTLDMLQSESRNRLMRRTLASIREALDGGMSLSQALSQHPRLFGPLYISVVEVGEYTGRLGPALEQLADMLEKSHQAKMKAIRTLMYPAAIVGMSLVTLVVLMLVAVPPLLEVFEDLGSDIPIVTRIAVKGMAGVRANLLNIFIALGALVALYVLLRKLPRTRFLLDKKMAEMPVVGPLIVYSEVSRFARTFSMLIEAGVVLSTSLKLSIAGAGNLYVKQAFLDAEKALLAGDRLAHPLFRYDILPTVFAELVMIGEEANTMGNTMRQAADTFEQLLDRQVSTLVATLEPASTLVVGAIVGFIAFAMFVPIYSGLDGLE